MCSSYYKVWLRSVEISPSTFPPKVGDMNDNVVKYYEFGIKSMKNVFIDLFIEF